MSIIEPTLTDFLCGKKPEYRDHPGTAFVRTECIEPILSLYDDAERSIKIKINLQITVQVYARQGRFLIMEKGDVWRKLSFKEAHRRVTTMVCNRFRTYRKEQHEGGDGAEPHLGDESDNDVDVEVDSFQYSSLSGEEWMEQCLEGTSILESHGSWQRTPSSAGASSLKVGMVPEQIAQKPPATASRKDCVDGLEISIRKGFASLRVSDDGTQSKSMEVSSQRQSVPSKMNLGSNGNMTELFSTETMQQIATNTDVSSGSRRANLNLNDASVRRRERGGQDDLLTVGTARGNLHQLSAVVARMNNTLRDADSQIKCFGHLTELSWQKWANRGIIGEAGGISGVIAAMGHHHEHPQVQWCGCLALTWLASWGNQESIAAAGGIKRIISSMQQHEYDGRVQHRACEVLAELVGGHRQSIVAAGEVEGVVTAMQRHLANEEVQLYGCKALGGLASFCTTTQALIVVEGGIDAVVYAMIHHVPNVHVQRHGFWTLALLAETSSDNQQAVSQSGGIGAIVEAMQCHSHNADLQHVGSRSLARLARDHPTNQKLIAQSGGVRALVDAMQNHENDDHVQGSVCFAFGCLAYRNVDNQMLIRRLNAQDWIKKASTRFAENDWLQRCAEYALEMMGIPTLCDGYHFGY